MKNNTTIGSHIGDVTHHHDQLIVLVSFKTRNTMNVNVVIIPADKRRKRFRKQHKSISNISDNHVDAIPICRRLSHRS